MWGIRGHRPRSKNEPTSNAYALPGASLQTKTLSTNWWAKKTWQFSFFLYIVVRLCKQAFNTIYYVQKRVETDISTLFAHHSFSRTFRLRKVRDSNPRYNAMCTPHFECGSFDHSDNFPLFGLQRYCFFMNCANNTSLFWKKTHLPLLNTDQYRWLQCTILAAYPVRVAWGVTAHNRLVMRGEWLSCWVFAATAPLF